MFHNSWIVTRCQSLLIIEGLETGIRGREVPGGEIKILGAKARGSALDGGGGYGVIGDGWWGGDPWPVGCRDDRDGKRGGMHW